MRTRQLVFAIAFAVLAVSAYLFLKPGRERVLKLDAESAAATPGTNLTTPAGARKALALPVHTAQVAREARRYALEFHNEFLNDPAHEDGGMLLGFSAELALARVASDAETTSFEVHLENIAPLAASPERNFLRSEESQFFRTALSVPYYATFDSEGRLALLRFAQRPDAMSENMLKLIAYALQQVRPKGAHGEWQTSELDTTGEVVVRYQEQEAKWTKTKLRYSRLLDETGLAESKGASEVEVKGTSSVTTSGETGAMVSLELEEDTAVILDKQRLENHAELALRFMRSEDPSAAIARWSHARALSSIALDRLPPARQVDPRQKLREVLGDRTPAQLVQAVEHLPAEDDARLAVEAQLEALLTLSPETVDQFQPLLKSKDEQKRSLVLSAMAGSSTPESQSVMRELVKDANREPGDRETAMALLGTSREPSEETVEFVKKTSEDVDHPNSRTATLALGNLIATARTGDNDKADDLFSSLVKRLGAARDPEEQALILRALGNTGDARLVELVTPYTQQQSPELRTAAYFALRSVQSPEAFALLQKGALSDPDQIVRIAVLQELRYAKRDGSLELVIAVLRNDVAPEVRMEALSVLVDLGSDAARQVIAQVANSDESPEVRAQAQQLLSAA